MKDIELIWRSPILDCSGYSAAARGYLKAADISGIKIRAYDRSRSLNLKNKGIDADILNIYKRLSETIVSSDCPAVQHQVPDQFFVDRNSKRPIGYSIFEMTEIPKSWVQPCNDIGEIWTGSEYSKKAFVNGGIKVPIFVLPHAIDIEAFLSAKPWTIKNKSSFTFLSIFDFTERKSWHELLRAYWTAFDKHDDVCLILKVFYSDFSDQARADIIRRIIFYRNSLKFKYDRAPILIYGYDVPNSDMFGLYKIADCYVGISREGFGMSYAEAMAAGLACIGPEVGGTREFMTPENSFLVKYTGDEPISNEMARLNPSFAGLSWATHSWENLVEVMRLVVSDNTLRKTRAAQGQADVAAQLNYREIGNKMINLLS